MTLEIVSSNVEDTFRLGEQIGRKLRGRECIELQSDLGGGKTAFVRGIAKGVGSTDQVASPTFTVSRHYTNSRGMVIYHYDFYRLPDAGVMEHDVSENLNDANGVVIIEWSGAVQNILPADRLTINILVTGENSRLFQFHAGSDHSHLVEGISV